MALDVFLVAAEPFAQAQAPQIWVREAGQQRCISRQEWDLRAPGREPVVFIPEAMTTTLYTANITQNLAPMARAADLYRVLWAPEEAGLAPAQQLIAPLRSGLARLEADPAPFVALAPANGWGTYAGLLVFVREYLAACEKYPDATVEVSR
jgi:hypothetical protein